MANGKNTYYVRREQGLCVGCGGSRDSERITCSACLAKGKIRNRDTYKGSGHTTKDVRRSNGLCPCCGDEPELGKKMCRMCLDKKAALVMGRAIKNRSNGLCDCGQKPTDGYAVCDDCIIKGREKRAKKTLLGKCHGCKKDAEPGRIKCLECAAKQRVSNSNRNQKNKEAVFGHYGWKCKCCGETIRDFLTIDHINGGGNQHVAELRKQGVSLYRWIIDNGYPDDLRILCMNCNFGRRKTGVCPHEELRRSNRRKPLQENKL